MKKIIREPLFHFLLIGAALFMIYTLANKNQTKDEIIIDTYVINDLSAKWKVQWNREPNTEELKKLIGLYINQEVLYREALAMNLDHNDEIIKRRLAKKMEFISDDLAESLQPSEELLKDYYYKNRQSYTKPPIFTFSQVFFKDEMSAIAALVQGNPQNSGDPLSLPNSYTDASALKISIDFGNMFVEALDTVMLGIWVGPIKSGYGNHLVFISEKKSAGYYTYEEVAEKVTLDYNYVASKDFRNELIKTLLKEYKIIFEVDDSNLKQKLIESY